MDPQQERQDPVEQLFDQVVGLPPEQREAFLREHCADADVLQRVQTLLRHDAVAGERFLGGIEPSASPAASPPPPQQIGPYAILKQLGEGGMGAVYEAEQDHPRRRVALKLIRTGLMSPPMLRRFAHEADVLARLDHAGIARIYDGGVVETPLGRQPYFAMELIAGVPLDQWTKKHNPSLKQRLQLFIAICDAVHHAHTKGVIHRDLKPSNILITADTQPKILDFGVARATDLDVQATTLHTATGEIVGTLAYMAPEQAAGRAGDLDTSSDVYALGVIAYELLSGRLPYVLKDKALHEAVAIICEQEPTRLSSIDRTLRDLRGDVETIVGKALEKDKTRRYQTAGELAADVKRHLDYQPITARPPGTWYQLSRFARRNKLLVGAVGAVVIALAVGLGLSTAMFLRERETRRRAVAAEIAATAAAAQSEQVASFLKEMLKSVGPSAAMGRDTKMLREILDKTAGHLNELKGHPAVEADLRATLGNVYADLGEYEPAAAMHQEALRLRRQALGDSHPLVAQSINDLGQAFLLEGKYPEAEEMHREALAMRKALLGPEHPDVATSLHNLAKSLRHPAVDRSKEAVPILRASLGIRRKLYGEESLEVADSLSALGMVLTVSQAAERATAFRKALAIRHKLLGSEHPDVATSLDLIFDDADPEPGRRESLAIRRKLFPPGHPQIGNSLNALAGLLLSQGRIDEAEPLAREALEIRRNRLPANHIDLARSCGTMAKVFQAQEKLDEAENLFRERWHMDMELLGATAPRSKQSLDELSAILKNMGRGAEIAALQREQAEHLASEANSPDPYLRFEAGRRYRSRGAALRDRGELQQGEEAFLRSLALLEPLTREHPSNVLYASNLGWAHYEYCALLNQARRPGEASAVRDQAIERLEKVLAMAPESGDCCSVAGRLYAEKVNPAANRQTQPAYRRACELLEQALRGSSTEQPLPAAGEQLGHLRRIWAFGLENAGRLQEADVLLHEALVAFEGSRSAGGNMPPLAHFIADTHRRIGAVKIARKLLPEAEQELRAAVEMHEQAVKQFPDKRQDENERADAYFDLGSLLVKTSRFDEAATLFTSGLEIKPDREQRCCEAAALYAFSGDVARYHGACRAMLERFARPAANSPGRAASIAQACTLVAPQPGDDLQQVQKLAERSVTGSEGDPAYPQFALARGLCEYRAGRYADALKWLQLAPSRQSATDPPHDVIVYAALAMTHHQIGDASEARTALDTARSLITKQRPTPGPNWLKWLHGEVLFRQAETLLLNDKPR